jgi:SagB-type dehydrogenase family enzyme
MSAPAFLLSLGPRARLERADGDGLRIVGGGLSVPAPAPGLAGALARLADGGASEEALRDEVGDTALLSLVGVLRALEANGLLRYRLMLGGRPLATLSATAPGFRFEADPPLVRDALKLSRFACIDVERDVPRLRSPLGRAEVELEDESAASVALALARPRTFDELAARAGGLEPALLEGLLVLLHNAAALAGADDAAPWWELHDLVFHMRSRRGRHDAPYGGTYRHDGRTPPPLPKPRANGAAGIALTRPDLDALRRSDPPFTAVLEQRRSSRAYGHDPLSLGELGELLYRAARYQAVVPGEETDIAFRPSPSGGALQELELYPAVARCDGLEPGIYHYRPHEHELTPVAGATPTLRRLLDEAWWTANRESPLQVCLIVTARCGRVFWKYESMAYALVLKNLGALYATLNLVATAMGLASTALGGGNSELFARATGLDPLEEPAVGEFLVGSRGEP